MQSKFLLCLALTCLAVAPALGSRALDGENELMDMAIQALEHSRALTAEESMVMATGAYGAGGMAGAYGGSAGGILDSDVSPQLPSSTGLEAGESNVKPAQPAAAAPAPTPAAKSAALPAHQSAGLLAAGLMAAAAFLL